MKWNAMSGRTPVAIYERTAAVRSSKENAATLNGQRRRCEAFITTLNHAGWEILTKRYQDSGASGNSLERPGLKDLMKDIRAGRVGVIVVTGLDRLFRDIDHLRKVAKYLRKRDVTVYCADPLPEKTR